MDKKLIVIIIFLTTLACFSIEREKIEQKSSTTAVACSIVTTILPSVPLFACMASHDVEPPIVISSIVLSAAGVVIGPSAGHFYANNKSLKSIGIRTTILVIGLTGTTVAFFSLPQEHFSTTEAGATFAIASGICLLGYALYDIATVPRSVEKYNESIGGHSQLYMVPLIDMRDKSYGVSLVYRF